MRGCRTKTRQPKTPDGDDVINYCYKVFERDNPSLYSDLLFLHVNWSKGIMPHAGGVYEQPALIPDALLSLEVGFNAGRSVLQEEAQPKSRPDGKGLTRR